MSKLTRSLNSKVKRWGFHQCLQESYRRCLSREYLPGSGREEFSGGSGVHTQKLTLGCAHSEARTQPSSSQKPSIQCFHSLSTGKGSISSFINTLLLWLPLQLTERCACINLGEMREVFQRHLHVLDSPHGD